MTGVKELTEEIFNNLEPMHALQVRERGVEGGGGGERERARARVCLCMQMHTIYTCMCMYKYVEFACECVRARACVACVCAICACVRLCRYVLFMYLRAVHTHTSIVCVSIHKYESKL